MAAAGAAALAVAGFTAAQAEGASSSKAPQQEIGTAYFAKSLGFLEKVAEQRTAACKPQTNYNGSILEHVTTAEGPVTKAINFPIIQQRQGERGETPTVEGIVNGTFAFGTITIVDGKPKVKMRAFDPATMEIPKYGGQPFDGPDFAVSQFVFPEGDGQHMTALDMNNERRIDPKGTPIQMAYETNGMS